MDSKKLQAALQSFVVLFLFYENAFIMYKAKHISKLKEHPNCSAVEDHLMKTSVFLKLELSLK